MIDTEFTVTYANSRYKYFGSTYATIHEEASERVSLSIELVSRSAPPPKVGDLLTGAQVQTLPDFAVFLSAWNVPRTVLNGMSYAPGYADEPLRFHDHRDPTYRLIYLPEEDN